MFEKISKKKLTGVILAGVLTVAGATSAFAADLPNSNQPVAPDKSARHEQFRKFDISKMSTTIKSAIDGLVSAGTITQAQADAVTKAYAPGEGKEMRKIIFKNPMNELVTAGTITQAQADAINAAIKSGRESNKTPEDVLKELVSAGTITQTQSDAVSKCFAPIDRKFDNIKIHRNTLNELITSGTITQAQADAIKDTLKNGKDIKPMKEVLDGLVAAGTITQEQADAVIKAFPLKVEKFINRGELKGLHDGMPFEGKGPNMIKFKNSPLDELVSAGTITQAQADAINIAIKSAMSSFNKQ